MSHDVLAYQRFWEPVMHYALQSVARLDCLNEFARFEGPTTSLPAILPQLPTFCVIRKNSLQNHYGLSVNTLQMGLYMTDQGLVAKFLTFLRQ